MLASLGIVVSVLGFDDAGTALLISIFALQDSFGITASSEDLARSDKGKPYLPAHPDAHFNLSHTEGLFAAATAKEPVGIDCEAITRPARIKALGARYFSPQEQAYLEKNDFSPEIFYLIWTKKESYVKYRGDGLSIPLPAFSTPPGYEVARCMGTEGDTAYQASYRIGDHIVTVTQKNGEGFIKNTEMIPINLSE